MASEKDRQTDSSEAKSICSWNADQFRNLPIWRVETQVATLLNATDILIDRVDSFQNSARQTFKLAQLVGLLGAIVLQIFSAFVGLKGIRSRQCETVHFGKFTSL